MDPKRVTAVCDESVQAELQRSRLWTAVAESDWLSACDESWWKGAK
jgi:hypothetical protein